MPTMKNEMPRSKPPCAVSVAEVLEVLLDLAEPHDRARHQLREQRDVCGELEEIAGRLDDAAIAVDDVADGVEGVERDADREDDVEMRHGDVAAEQMRGVACRGEAEIGILEEAEQHQVAVTGMTRQSFRRRESSQRSIPSPAK